MEHARIQPGWLVLRWNGGFNNGFKVELFRARVRRKGVMKGDDLGGASAQPQEMTLPRLQETMGAELTFPKG